MDEKKNVAKEEKANEAKNAEQVTVNDDEYNVSAFDDESGVATSHTTEVVYKTRYTIQKTNVIVGSGETKENYAIAFLTKLAGQDYKSVLRIRPRRKGGTNLEDLAKLIMSLPVEHKLEIVEKTITGDRGTSKTYSMRMSCLTDEGVPFVCPLEPVGVSDTAIWENFRRQIFARGDYEVISNK